MSSYSTHRSLAVMNALVQYCSIWTGGSAGKEWKHPGYTPLTRCIQGLTRQARCAHPAASAGLSNRHKGVGHLQEALCQAADVATCTAAAAKPAAHALLPTHATLNLGIPYYLLLLLCLCSLLVPPVLSLLCLCSLLLLPILSLFLPQIHSTRQAWRACRRWPRDNDQRRMRGPLLAVSPDACRLDAPSWAWWTPIVSEAVPNDLCWQTNMQLSQFCGGASACSVM